MAAVAPAEKTFRSFTPAEASAYAQYRMDYHPTLYNTILARHTSTGGQLRTILDVGCGPGTAVRMLATRFQQATGLDPSEGMIAGATKIGGTTGSGADITFVVGSAEELPEVRDASVDLLTAATAAHWFDMPAFWARAAQVLKPGGSVALWTSGDTAIDDSVPNAAAMQAALDALRVEHLEPYMLRGNWLVQDLYADLPLPWGVEPAVAGFHEESFLRQEWGTGAEGALPRDEFFAIGAPEVDMHTLEAVLGTASPVARWREANKDKVDTERDVVRKMRREVERLLHEGGIEKGKEFIKGGSSGVLLFVKKVA
ncbi:S-adenosyl-L-methionine-dependent methyltransferase [Eremomyces bilateralis CBS 781.70]|uniref:S-adenosyl-L-methionine-dependent methyltransferase n=1 Tax=Eremomyces bilateralis CBS 781.70 TaxID=1392243 RepID=A0A6G1FWT4_9PEZI|nr:S-adenosyl-L-methionine-dependent methyltransferase [Eremomyces bilateralis CBS 781.70]KAF1810198.1 S-adenosyl-L-methionine-dependent methyltransferase [Eremomyces bilateralis CBS 781.70]